MLFLGDFNGDRHKDVIALETANGAFLPQLFLGRGDGTFQDPLPVSNALPGYSYAVADINGDGRDDLVYTTMDPASATGALNVLLSNGDRTLDPITTTLPGNGYSYGLPAAADFNGDGKMDVVIAEQKTMQVLLGHGDGAFDTTLPMLPVPSFNNQQYGCCGAVIAGDFDHDGNADFAFLRDTPGSTEGPTALIVYYGKGDGTFSQAVTAAVLDRDYVHLIAADLNGDGLSDFVLSTTEGNGGNNDYRGTAISIVHSLPGRKFSGETNLVAGAGFASMAAADFTGDGQPDLLFTNGSLADSLVLLTNVGTPAMTLTSSANPSVIGQAVAFTATIRAPMDLT
jgi:FG-GAP-like repeat